MQEEKSVVSKDLQNPRNESSKTISERNYFINELLVDLGTNTLYKLKANFDKFGGQVNLAQFVRLIRESVLQEASTEKKLKYTERLQELFTEIDINGDGDLTWEEFTEYIIKNGFLKSEDNSANPSKKRNHGTSGVSQALSNALPTAMQTQEVVLVKELKGHTGAVLNVEHIADYNYICTSSTDSSILFFDCNTNFRQKGELFLNYPQLSLAYSPQFHTLYSGGTDGIIHLWNLEEYQQKMLMNDQASNSSSNKKTSNGHRNPMNSSAIGNSTGKIKERAILSNGHSDMIMDLQVIHNTPLIVSAGMDAKIVIWDMGVTTKHKDLLGHVKGVFSLSYAAEHRLLFSASFDRDILVWNPMVEALVYRLKGHHTSLIGVQAIEGTHQVVSADIDGYFKVWDIRTFECIQTFTSQFSNNSETNAPDLSNRVNNSKAKSNQRNDQNTENTTNEGEDSMNHNVSDTKPAISGNGMKGLRGFTVAAPYNQIYAGTKKLHIFEFNRPGNPQLSADDAIIDILYNDYSNTFLTASGKEVKIWNASTGVIERTFSNISEHKISSVCLDNRRRKFILGDTKGNICVCNYNNGGNLRVLDSHSGEVSSLIYGVGKSVISGSWDSKINIHNELLPHNVSTVVKSVHCNEKDVTRMSYSRSLSLFASSDSSSCVRVWDFDTLSPEFYFRLEAEITCFPVVFVGDSQGWLHIWSTRPAQVKNICLHKLQNIHLSSSSSSSSNTTNESTTTPIQSVTFLQSNLYLVTGDEGGFITVWNLRHLFSKHAIHPFISKKRNAFLSKKETHDSNTFEVNFKLTDENSVDELIPVVKRWKAHSDFITCLQTIGESTQISEELNSFPAYVLSGSRDKRVKVWEITTGKQMGTLMQSPSGDVNWISIPFQNILLAEGEKDAEEVMELKNRTKNKQTETIGVSITATSMKQEDTPKINSKSIQSSSSHEKIGFLFPIESKVSSIPAIQTIAPIHRKTLNYFATGQIKLPSIVQPTAKRRYAKSEDNFISFMEDKTHLSIIQMSAAEKLKKALDSISV